MATAPAPAELTIRLVPTASLRLYPGNPRRGNVQAISESLATNGQYRPIVVNTRDDTVLAGNHTLMAARHLGWENIAATFIDVDETAAARIVLADNRTAELGGYDESALAELLASVNEDAGLAGTGYDDGDLSELLAGLKPADAPEAFPAFDDETIPIEHRCPRCGYEYSGKGA